MIKINDLVKNLVLSSLIAYFEDLSLRSDNNVHMLYLITEIIMRHYDMPGYKRG